MEPSSLCNFLALLSMAFCCVLAFKDGAPFSKCDDMLPGHGEARVAPKDAKPYAVVIDVLTSNLNYKPNEDFKVHLSAIMPGVTFKGFFIQCRDLGGIRAGTFKTNSSEIKLVNCDGQQPTAATHTNNDTKTNLTVEWIAPATTRGRLDMYVTFVKDHENYYAKVKSNWGLYPQHDLFPQEPDDDTMEPNTTTEMPVPTTIPNTTTEMPVPTTILAQKSKASSLMNAWSISGILVSLILFC